MSKAVLQSVGEDTVAFGDVCYWVAENVKRFLPNFQAGMEVDVTVKDIDGVPMVTFLKKAGFPTQPAGAKPAYGAPAQQYQAPPQQYQAPKPPMTPPVSNHGIDGNLALAAVKILEMGLNVDEVKSIMAALKQA